LKAMSIAWIFLPQSHREHREKFFVLASWRLGG
jgi:hypothetical protein